MLTPVKNAWARIDSEFNGAPGRLAAAAGRVVSAISTRLWGAVDTLVSPFRDAWSKIQGLISNITSAPGNIKSTIGRLIPKFASGGILYGPRTIIAGEAGAEAIVPLNRPLSMVDPSVRALSAVAQGKMSPAMLTGATGKSINVEAGAISVQSPNSDPELVAQSVLDRLVNEIL